MPAATGPSWPTMTEYQEAIQSPKLCFAGRELRTGRPVLNKLGLPRPVCGQFASVYEVTTRGSRWAIKCFLRNTPDLHKRYAKIADHLGTVTLPYFVDFDYLDEGIRVRGHWFPIVRMKWVDGLPLNEFVQKNLLDRGVLETLEQDWVRLLDDLRSVKVAHADLQHGNVLVAPDGRLRLIDYDGMWVPPLDGETSHEIGHPDYQCPLRTGRDFHAEIDRFAGDVILVALRALVRRPALWEKYDNGENLLFRRWDFLEPATSGLFEDLRDLGDDEINARLESIVRTCGGRAAGRAAGQSMHATPDMPAMNTPGGNVHKAADIHTLGVRSPAKTVAVPRQPQRRQRPQQPRHAPGPPAMGTGVPPAAPVAKPAPATMPVAAPAAAARPPEGSVTLGVARGGTFLALLSAMAVAAVMEFPVLLGRGGDDVTRLPGVIFCLGTALGLVSLFTLPGRRPGHRNVHNAFCGLAVVIILGTILGELLVGRLSHWTGDDRLQCALMLSMLVSGALGLLLERAWARRCVS